MQKISEILNSPTAPAETGARASNRPTTSDAGNWIWSNDERLAGRPGVPEPVPCEFCGTLRYHKGIPLGNRILWPPYGAERCTCPEAVAAYEKAKAEREAAEAAAAKAEEEKKMRDRIKRIVGESGMGDRFLRRTFSTFQLTDDNKRAAAAARRYLFDLVEAAGFGVKSEIVWDKGTPGMGVGWRSQHELILFGAKAATHFDGHKGYGNVLSISRSGNELHPTQKPVELLEKLVDNTDFATGVYDPFGGSGTTLAACEAYGQPSYIMELTPAFTDVIVKRYIRIPEQDIQDPRPRPAQPRRRAGRAGAPA